MILNYSFSTVIIYVETTEDPFQKFFRSIDTMHLSYLIVGSGYRARFYARIARTYPELFSAMFLCRSEEKAELIQQETGIPAKFC